MSEQELLIGASGREAGQRSPTARAGGVGLDARLRYGVIGYSYWDPQLTRNRDRLPLARVTHIAELAPDHTATYGEFQLSYRYGDIVSPHIDWAEPLAVEARDFTAAIREGRSPRSDGREGLRVVRVLEARDRSLASGGAFVDIGQEEP